MIISIETDEYISADRVSYDLKKPCGDCPFRRDAPDHTGVAKAIPGYIEAINDGRFAHTCHKTDNRSGVDGPRNHNGPVQHCVGALHFLIRAKKDLQLPLLQAIQAGKVDASALVKRARKDKTVFRSVRAMLLYYLAMVQRQKVSDDADPMVVAVREDSSDQPEQMRLSVAKAQGLEVLLCKICGKPAQHADAHWPYHCDCNYCDECVGETLDFTEREYQAELTA